MAIVVDVVGVVEVTASQVSAARIAKGADYRDGGGADGYRVGGEFTNFGLFGVAMVAAAGGYLGGL